MRLDGHISYCLTRKHVNLTRCAHTLFCGFEQHIIPHTLEAAQLPVAALALLPAPVTAAIASSTATATLLLLMSRRRTAILQLHVLHAVMNKNRCFKMPLRIRIRPCSHDTV